MAKRPWEPRWKELRALSAGGQGRTILVTEHHDSHATPAVLKVLHKPSDPERRARLLREIDALRELDGEGVPKLLDHSFPDASSEDAPFVVMEYIDGSTLEQVVSRGVLDLDQALSLVDALLTVVAATHRAGFLHRDIKADNVMLREQDHGRPVLIDFGQAAGATDLGDLTDTEQQLGNRFLELPELRTPGDNKRDPRSDLTSCCGILFYALTASRPMTLIDGSGKKPHQRELVQLHLGRFEGHKQVALARLWDKAFKLRVDERFQSVQDLREALQNVRAAAPVAHAPLPKAKVESLWTLHVLRGAPDRLYTNHRLAEGGDLDNYFKGSREPAPLRDLDSSVQHAAQVLWNEVLSTPEVNSQLPTEGRFRHALDHLSHVLDVGMAGGPSTGPQVLTWQRELDRPNGRVSGPGASLLWERFSAAGRAAVATLDATARSAASAVLDEAIVLQTAWDSKE